MKYGIREICDVVLRAKYIMQLGNRKFYKHEPVLYFDTLKTSSLEGAATTNYATGGRGNSRLIAWEGERTLTFTFEDALISSEGLAVLTGAGLIDASKEHPIYVHQTSKVVVDEKGKIVLPEGVKACWNKLEDSDEFYHKEADIFCMTLSSDGKEIVTEPCVPSAVDNAGDSSVITCIADGNGVQNGEHKLAAGDVVLVDYYIKRTSKAQQIEITADKFAGNYYLEASTLFRDEATGKDMPAEFIIPNGKIQSNFTFAMASSGDPSTFTFVMDAFPDYIKFDKTKKVLCAVQIITDVTGEDNMARLDCGHESFPGAEEEEEI